MADRIGVRCASCKSLERTRAIKLVLDSLELPRVDSRILHFAPERGLTRLLSTVTNHYELLDYAPEKYRWANVRKFDLVVDSPSLLSNHYDLILHSHVLEHVPCNLAYLFFHLFRALKPDGYHIFCLPLKHGCYEEDLGPLLPEDATRRFGQSDHVRRFGIADIDRHLGMIIKLNQHYALSDYASGLSMDKYNIPLTARTGFNSSTVFVSRKDDYLLVDQ